MPPKQNGQQLAGCDVVISRVGKLCLKWTPRPGPPQSGKYGRKIDGVGYVKVLEYMRQGIRLESAKCEAARLSGIFSFGSKVQCRVRDEHFQLPENIPSHP